MGDNAGWYVDTVLAGMSQHPTPPKDTIQQLTGHPAITFGTWAAANADSFR
jgi:hypothetical protein